MPRRATASGPRGFTILELLVCVAIIAVLAGLVLPAVSAARESARRLQCTHHLKQIGLALHAYHEVQGSLPPGWLWDARRATAYGWLPPLLSYVEQDAVRAQVDFSSGISSSSNTAMRVQIIPLFLCPSDIVERQFMLYVDDDDGPAILRGAAIMPLPAASYLGLFGTGEPDDGWPGRFGNGIFPGSRAIRFADVNRGLSCVLAVGERTAASLPSTWLGIDVRGEDAPCRILGNALTGPSAPGADECEFSSRHAGAANFLWGDGHVRPVANEIDARAYRQWARRDVAPE
jgi:prepilin-type N-terminal cleavage/methylation domain-containing protein/prepilin-type processing-associated H-X9-DG protein